MLPGKIIHRERRPVSDGRFAKA